MQQIFHIFPHFHFEAYQPVLLAHRVEVIHPAAVLGIIRRVHAHDGMQAFLAAVYQRRARQLQLVDDGVLRLDVQAVAFHQSVAVLRHVVVFAALTIQRVEGNLLLKI